MNKQEVEQLAADEYQRLYKRYPHNPDLPSSFKELPKLNSTTKKAWLEKLRSGEWKQTTCQLGVHIPGHEPRFCCLGVLAIQSRKAKWKGISLYYSSHKYDLGVKGYGGVTKPHQEILTVLNDAGATFKQIASFIERHW